MEKKTEFIREEGSRGGDGDGDGVDVDVDGGAAVVDDGDST